MLYQQQRNAVVQRLGFRVMIGLKRSAGTVPLYPSSAGHPAFPKVQADWNWNQKLGARITQTHNRADSAENEHDEDDEDNPADCVPRSARFDLYLLIGRRIVRWREGGRRQDLRQLRSATVAAAGIGCLNSRTAVPAVGQRFPPPPRATFGD